MLTIRNENCLYIGKVKIANFWLLNIPPVIHAISFKNNNVLITDAIGPYIWTYNNIDFY